MVPEEPSAGTPPEPAVAPWLFPGDPRPGGRMQLPRGIAEHIQAMILGGGLKPGDRLPSQRELAARLGVSRPSLREAISVIEAMGLVSVRVGSGVFVASPDERAPLWRFSDRASPRDVYEARLGLEGFAARLAASRCDAAADQRLRGAVDAMAEALAGADIAAMAMADTWFHDLVVEVAANPVLAAMVRPIRDMMVESQRLPMAMNARLGETLTEHQDVLARLAARDADGAEKAMRRHIRAAAHRCGIAIG